MSEMTKAMELALYRGPRRMACCPDCEEPLISTIAWSYYEFYCLCCGNHVGYVMPLGKEETPEILARYAELKAEWDEHAEGIMPKGSFRIEGCQECERGENHRSHMTVAEEQDDVAAREWLAERVGK